MISKTVLVCFFDKGLPKTGLTPLIKIINVASNATVVYNDAMTEVGNGFYKYSFLNYDPAANYAIICDGGSSLIGGDRYAIAGNESFVEDLEATEVRGGYIP